MTRFVTLTVQVRPHSESIEVDGRKFTNPTELWQYLHEGASVMARKSPDLARSLFVSDESLQAWREAIASCEVEYSTPPGGVGITRLPARARELAPGQSKVSFEDMGL